MTRRALAHTLVALLALVAGGCALTGDRAVDARQGTVELHLEPVLADGAVQAFDARMRFTGSRDGRTVLQLPDEWGGETGLHRAIADLRSEGALLQPAVADAPARRELRHAPGATVDLRWRVQTSPQAPKTHGNDYQVRIGPRFFHLLGNAFVVQPGHLARTTPARFSVGTLPAGLRWASDLEHGRMGRALTLDDLVDSVLVGGEVRVIDAGGGARLAIHGEVQGRSDAQWREAFDAIARAQRAFWNAAAEPYLVTIWARPAPRPGHVSTGGTGRGDAFAFFVTDNADAARIDATLSHEMMHSWVPNRIGDLPEGPQEALHYWLSEGFTDWAHRAALVRGGHWQPVQWLQAVNEQLKAHDLSPVRGAANAEIAARFWQDPQVQALPYQRGALLGLWWDHRIRDATGQRADLRAVLLRMQRMSASHPRLVATERLPLAVAELSGLDIAQDLRRFVQQGEDIPLPEDAIAPCARLRVIERPAFDRGFDVEATLRDGNRIRGVRPDGPAWAAGMRDGMRLVARHGGEFGNAEVEITYEVDDQGRTRFLRYHPAGRQLERFRRFEPLPAALAGAEGADAAACRRRLSGL